MTDFGRANNHSSIRSWWILQSYSDFGILFCVSSWCCIIGKLVNLVAYYNFSETQKRQKFPSLYTVLINCTSKSYDSNGTSWDFMRNFFPEKYWVTTLWVEKKKKIQINLHWKIFSYIKLLLLIVSQGVYKLREEFLRLTLFLPPPLSTGVIREKNAARKMFEDNISGYG